MLHIFAQSHRVNVRVPISRIVEFDVGNLRRELAIADVVKIVSLRIPDRIESIECVVGDAC